MERATSEKERFISFIMEENCESMRAESEATSTRRSSVSLCHGRSSVHSLLEGGVAAIWGSGEWAAYVGEAGTPRAGHSIA